MSDNHVVWHEVLVSRSDRNRLNDHASSLVWFTRLSAQGKSTIAHAVEKALFDRGIRSNVHDGDNVRHGINSNLGFSKEDRQENLRLIAEAAKLSWTPASLSSRRSSLLPSTGTRAREAKRDPLTFAGSRHVQK